MSRRSIRVLSVATLVNAFGNGAYLATSVTYLTRIAGLSPSAMAVGLSVGAAAGIVAMTPLGYVADRYGPKRLQILGLLVLAGAYAALIDVRTPGAFAAVSCVIAVAMALSKSANGALAAGAVPAAERLHARAYLRSAINLGIGLGTLAGSIPLVVHTAGAYAWILVLNVGSFLVAAVVIAAGVPEVARQQAPESGPRLIALRDRPFLAFAALDGLLTSTFNDLLSIGLPLWLVARTHAPLWLISAALVVNTAGCVLLQVRAARGIDGVPAGARIARHGAALIGVACVLFGLTAGLPSWAVGLIVLLAAVVHVLGELWLSTGSWAIVFGLAPETAQGQYQGTYFAGRQAGDMIAPLLITFCVLGLHTAGWFALAVLFVIGGRAYRPIVAGGRLVNVA
ncbi:MFS transporter [Paractinoplanes globisporus]|uniref:MFS transporter n=1 Tax=Paractinoplanes globisporus TaxID=113565 RepID=A0ABW6WDM2_9ACTN|nr:MFS transporter [Actinoplanes globisporus]